jgi:hypothetical protein
LFCGQSSKVLSDKSRYSCLRLPSAEEKRIEQSAKIAELLPAKFVIEIVENALADDAEFKCVER